MICPKCKVNAKVAAITLQAEAIIVNAQLGGGGAKNHNFTSKVQLLYKIGKIILL